MGEAMDLVVAAIEEMRPVVEVAEQAISSSFGGRDEAQSCLYVGVFTVHWLPLPCRNGR